MSIRVRYNKDTLETCINKYNSILEEDYDKLTSYTRIKFICKCGKNGEKRFDLIYKNGSFCKECTNKIKVEKIKATSMERYGVENVLQSKVFRDKMKATNLEKYGVDCYVKAKDFQSKMKATNLEKYGVEHVLQSKVFKDKMKATNLERYGIEHVLQIKEVKDKIKCTNIERYGVFYPGQSEEVKDKMKATNLERYGVEYSLQYKEFKDKSKDTTLKKYGVEYAMQSKEISEKQSKNAYKKKNITTPSGNMITLQGYEPQAYKLLLESYKEEEIINSRIDVPEIWWVDDEDKIHRYYVDFYIPKDNLMIEIKSKRTYSIETDKIEKKLQASNDAGYNIELWILDEKGNILEKIVKHLSNVN